jgi:hypothetical protein
MGFFLSVTASRLSLEPIQPPIQWVKRPGHEADHSPPHSAEVQSCTSTSPARLRGVVLS